MGGLFITHSKKLTMATIASLVGIGKTETPVAYGLTITQEQFDTCRNMRWRKTLDAIYEQNPIMFREKGIATLLKSRPTISVNGLEGVLVEKGKDKHSTFLNDIYEDETTFQVKVRLPKEMEYVIGGVSYSGGSSYLLIEFNK